MIIEATLSLSRLRASIPILFLLFSLIPALSFSQPIVIHQVACYSPSKAILYNGTVLELPSLKHLVQLGPIEGCDIYEGYGEHIAVWRNGRVEVYDGLNRQFEFEGDRAYIGMRFVLATAKDFVAVYSLYGFQVFRLDNYTDPAYVRLLGVGRAGPKVVLLITPTLCKVGMTLRSYILVYDLDMGLWDTYNTGAVSFVAIPSGALWIKNDTLYYNGQAIGKAPDRIYAVNGFDGYVYTQKDRVILVAMNGSTYTLPVPSGRELAVSRLAEGFVACSNYECVCQFNCTGFSQIANQAFSPPTVTETDTYYLLYANTVLYLLAKPKPTAPQSHTQSNNTQPTSHTPTNTTMPQNNASTNQSPVNTTLPQNGTMPQNNAPANNTPSTQNTTANTGTQSTRQNSGQGPSMFPVIPLILATALALLGYTLYKKKYRYIA
jgi:hypothetical protein